MIFCKADAENGIVEDDQDKHRYNEDVGPEVYQDVSKGAHPKDNINKKERSETNEEF